MSSQHVKWRKHDGNHAPFSYVRIYVDYYFPAASQDIELGFKETDRAVTEGDNEDFSIRRYSQSDLTDEVVLRVIPLTVSGFENYRNTHSSRIFAQSILDDVAQIADPAECEH